MSSLKVLLIFTAKTDLEQVKLLVLLQNNNKNDCPATIKYKCLIIAVKIGVGELIQLQL